MSHLELVVNFGLPPKEHARDLVRLLAAECDTDGLATLLSRATTLRRDGHDDFAPLLPQENWLRGKADPVTGVTRQHGLELAAGHWFLIRPVHLHVATNHLVLTDYRRLELAPADARELFTIAQRACTEAGCQLIAADPAIWLLRADSWHDLATSSPDAACGHNIDVWSPKGSAARAWRKLQNEIQMEWFQHPLQEQRQHHGLAVINGLWIWGGTRIDQPALATTPLLQAPNGTDWLEQGDVAQRLVIIDDLSAAALAADWAVWAATMRQLDNDWFKPLCRALKSGHIEQLDLVLGNSNTLLTATCRRSSLRHFWRSVRFTPLCS